MGFLGTRGFETLHERLKKLLDAIELVSLEIETVISRELQGENPKMAVARTDFLVRLSESAQSEALTLLDHIEQYYFEPNQFQQT